MSAKAKRNRGHKLNSAAYLANRSIFLASKENHAFIDHKHRKRPSMLVTPYKMSDREYDVHLGEHMLFVKDGQ